MANELAAISANLSAIRSYVATIASTPAVRDSKRGGAILRAIAQMALGELLPIAPYIGPEAAEFLRHCETSQNVTDVASLRTEYAELSNF